MFPFATMENYDAWQQHSSNPTWSVPTGAGLRRRTSAGSSSNKRESDDDMKIPAAKRSLEEPDSLDDEQSQRKKLRSMGDGGTPSEAWSEETHRQFVNAIYEIGMAHASPAVIMENMTKSHQALTSERIKSHLQKYRNNKAKSKDEFLTEYESWLQKALTVGAASGSDSNLSSPTSLIEMMGTDELLGGELAAFLTYASLVEEQSDRSGIREDPTLSNFASIMIPPANLANELAKYEVGAKIPFPILTDEERKSHLGASISHLVGLFYSMTNFVMKAREEKIKEEEESPPPKKMESSSQWAETNATDQPERGTPSYERVQPQYEHGSRRDMSYHPSHPVQHGFQPYNPSQYAANEYPVYHFSYGDPPTGPKSSDHYQHHQRRKRDH